MGEFGRLEMIAHARNTPALPLATTKPGGTAVGGRLGTAVKSKYNKVLRPARVAAKPIRI
ncbi:hypothetical protein TBK1r_17930 [Stieleria magnilauensis]|uniref:Uncharacterized protein n=1 Tax=Stieleria magnilauensis TaxID=2527963 RepID=A0ABX5XQG5_9BACT|nr:hypothetical protein TBK1r_17930 [Planctomycetes bacterium TBK1r]